VFLKSSLRLKSRKKSKADSVITSRTKPVEDTLDKIIPLCKKIGVTRLADITQLDKLYIPNYSSVLPGTEDKIWVYSGKGATKNDAKASALMESIERYSSLQSTSSRNFIQSSYSKLKSSEVLHPSEVVEPLRFDYENHMIMDFLPGFDLFTNNKILIPASLALSVYSPKNSTITTVEAIVNPFAYQHSNGLASGNVLEEAICHALCEVIERDAASIAELCASAIPYTYLKRFAQYLKENGYSDLTPAPDKFVDDPNIFPDVDISELVKDFEPVKNMVRRFAAASIPLLNRNIPNNQPFFLI
jgi:thioglycine synthase